MRAYKCDRCGDFYSQFIEPKITVNSIFRHGIGTNDSYASESHFSELNLCEKCVSDFEHWWTTVYRTKPMSAIQDLDKE